MNILVAEDDFISRNFLQFLLKSFGEVDVAVNGVEAVDAVRDSLERGEPYKIIFMDIMMPEKNGLDASREIRELEREFGVAPADEVSIIMATALSDVKTVITAFKDSEATSYLVKPLTHRNVLDKLAEMGFTNDK